jgi:hypothetical protein
MPITLDDLQSRYDFPAAEARVAAVVAGACADASALVRLLGRYIQWNSGFGPGVATLAGKIGRQHDLFVDADEPIAALADRSVHVASFVFDAARDEFDDSATRHRDTHRSLGQAVIKGLLAQLQVDPAVLDRPAWLVGLEERTQRGYGYATPDDLRHIGLGLGFHLGSEILADEEFSLIDQTLRAQRPELVQALLRMRVTVADHDHPAYYWIGIHSGHGGSVEAEHFAWAVKGVGEAFRYTPPADHEALREAILAGFDAFCVCHEDFFRQATAP